jgi:hypothetical protein
MALYILNEWLWADIVGENGPPNRSEALALIEKLQQRSDQIVIVQGSPFEAKSFGACKSQDVLTSRIAGVFMKAIRQDLTRCRILGPDEVEPLPEEFRRDGVKPDDDYLVQARRACPEATIVTTDHPLAAILDKHGVPWRFRDDFLRDYLR